MPIPLIQAALTAIAGMGLAAIFSADEEETERKKPPARLPDDPAPIAAPTHPPALPAPVPPPAQEPAAFPPVPEEQPEEDGMCGRLEGGAACLSIMATRMEQVVELYSMGMKQRDIADQLGIGLGTVNRELQHAREQGIIV